MVSLNVMEICLIYHLNSVLFASYTCSRSTAALLARAMVASLNPAWICDHTLHYEAARVSEPLRSYQWQVCHTKDQ